MNCDDLTCPSHGVPGFVASDNKQVLNLGCGTDIMQDATNLDIFPFDGVVVHNLDDIPWPFGNGEFGTVHAKDVFEHVEDPLSFMYECWRVLDLGGLLHIRTSYWNTKGSFTDPTHRRFCTENTFDYWIPNTFYYQKYPHYRGGAVFLKEKIETSGEELEVRLRRWQ